MGTHAGDDVADDAGFKSLSARSEKQREAEAERGGTETTRAPRK